MEVTSKLNFEGFRQYKPANFFVYILRSNNEVVYIGKTKNLAYRLVAHSKKQFDNVLFREFKSELEASLTEVRYISKYKPKYNQQHIPLLDKWEAATWEKMTQ